VRVAAPKAVEAAGEDEESVEEITEVPVAGSGAEGSRQGAAQYDRKSVASSRRSLLTVSVDRPYVGKPPRHRKVPPHIETPRLNAMRERERTLSAQIDVLQLELAAVSRAREEELALELASRAESSSAPARKGKGKAKE
jgi:hypothetical protein